jgi:hypothetical protein
MVTGFVGMVTGLCSLMITAGATYFTLVLHLDDLRVVIGEPPTVYISRKELEAVGQQQLIFMNVGNRHAAVSNVKAKIIRWSEQDELDCPTKENKTFFLYFKPDAFVIRPGEVLVAKVDFQEGFWRKSDLGYKADNTVLGFKSGDVFLICLSVGIATPDNYSKEILKPAFKYTGVGYEAPLTLNPYRPLFEHNRPIILLNKSGSILTNWWTDDGAGDALPGAEKGREGKKE